MTEVLVEHEGETKCFAADVFVVACGAANTAKLLLTSANDKHPNGLANGSDQVGRNYMFHNSQAVLALSREENPTIFQKTLGLNDFYFAGGEFEYPLGNIQMVGKSQAEMYRGEQPGETRLAPEWTLERVAKHAIDFWLSTEDLPLPDNRVTVDKDGKLTLSYTPSNEVPKQKLYEKLRSILGKLDLNEGHLLKRFAYMKNEIPVAGVAHQAGTCRFGADPATSVLDVDCRAHELDNLYVVDTSVFPSIGAVNPALTAMANSLRVGDHLTARLASARAVGRAGRAHARRAARRGRRVRWWVAFLCGGGPRPARRLHGRRDEHVGPRPGARSPGRTVCREAPTSSAAAPISSPSTSPRRATRSTASFAGPGGRSPSASRPGSRSRTRCIRSRVFRSHSRSRSSMRCGRQGSKYGRGRRNVGTEACPFGAGAHPYLVAGTPTVDAALLRVPADSVLQSDAHGIPVGSASVAGTEYDFRQPRPIGGTTLDTAFTGLARDAGGLARVELSASRPGRRCRALGRRALPLPDAVHR